MKRRRAARIERRLARVLLVCGGKTEFNYFATLKRVRGTELRAALTIKEIGAGSPEVTVREAAKLRNADRNFERDDHCACLLDVEPHDESMVQSLERALALAEKERIQVYVSNPCFEVWLLAHHDSARHRFADSAGADALLKATCGQDKQSLNANPRLFEELVRRVDEATTTTRTLCRRHATDASSYPDDGLTTVHELVQFLFRELDEGPVR